MKIMLYAAWFRGYGIRASVAIVSVNKPQQTNDAGAIDICLLKW